MVKLVRLVELVGAVGTVGGVGTVGKVGKVVRSALPSWKYFSMKLINFYFRLKTTWWVVGYGLWVMGCGGSDNTCISVAMMV